MQVNNRSGLYQASNVSFDPVTKKSLSYSWWTFTKVIEGKLIFNDWQYSSTTRKHQCKVKSLLSSLNITIDQIVFTKKSLSDFSSLEGLYLDSEESLCNLFLTKELIKQDRYLNQKIKKLFQLRKEGQNEQSIQTSGFQ